MGLAEDKIVERNRYDRRAQALLQVGREAELGPDGALAIPLFLRTPYLRFEGEIRRYATPGKSVLDLCCGNGLYSVVAAVSGAHVTASDIAPNNVELARRRAQRAGRSIETIVSDAEQVPLPDHSFDVIICAGSLSYLDLTRFLAEVRRLLVPGGIFLCVDSLDHNPFYRLNRYVQFVRGQRTLSTIRRMPTLATIATLGKHFRDTQVSFHGCLSFLCPVLAPFLAEARIARILDGVDDGRPLARRMAFKFVFSGRTR